MLKKIFSLTTLLSLLILSIAGSAAYFSIYGLMLIFSGAPIAVAIMAGTLETGKLILTSVLFNYWKRLNALLTMYGIVAIFFLMVITSGGIYGFLSSAYQTSQIPLEQINVQMQSLDQEIHRGQQRIQELDRIIASIGANYVTKRIEEKKQQAAERDSLQQHIDQIYKEKLALASKKMETEVHIGPIIKIAEAFDLPQDKAVHYLILLFIIVFDPLAVALTLCLNAIIAIKKEDTETHTELQQPVMVSTPPHVEDDIETNINVSEPSNGAEKTTVQYANTNPDPLPKYDDTKLMKKLDDLAKDMELFKQQPNNTPPTKNDLRQKLINNTRNGELE